MYVWATVRVYVYMCRVRVRVMREASYERSELHVSNNMFWNLQCYPNHGRTRRHQEDADTYADSITSNDDINTDLLGRGVRPLCMYGPQYVCTCTCARQP